jgi:hypothetical protein
MQVARSRRLSIDIEKRPDPFHCAVCGKQGGLLSISFVTAKPTAKTRKLRVEKFAGPRREIEISDGVGKKIVRPRIVLFHDIVGDPGCEVRQRAGLPSWSPLMRLAPDHRHSGRPALRRNSINHSESPGFLNGSCKSSHLMEKPGITRSVIAASARASSNLSSWA